MKRLQIVSRNPDLALIQEVKDALMQGKIVALPTETVYGLAARASDDQAVKRLYDLKKRDLDKPCTLHVGDIDKALSLFCELPPYGHRLVENFWPGPLTLIYYNRDGNKVGVRVPAQEVLQKILIGLPDPIYLPSANISGEKEAVTADEVAEKFSDSIDMLVDGGAPIYFKSSSVVDITFHPFKILREGAIAIRDIVDVFIRKRLVFVCTGNTCRSVMAEYLLVKYLEEYDPYLLERYEIISCGISAPQGSLASVPVAEMLSRQEGISVADHQAYRINRHIILSADLIIPMEDQQMEHIIKMEPTAEARVIPLRKFLPGDENKDIADPIGQTPQVYQDSYEKIKTAIMELREWL
jgi:tRNA threonylcarbamoyl adenosine modification protein (Sua5/YciO/YrdC/YwlC family)